MIRAVARVRRRTAGTGEQRGFALLVVITVIGVFSVVVVALLSMLFTDLRVQSLALRGDQATRAVDGALETAVDQLKISPTGSLGRINRECSPVGQGTGTDPNSLTIDGVVVTVDCSPVAGTPSALLPSTKGAAVLLLGGYTGPFDDIAAAPLPGQLGTAITGGASLFSNALATSGPGLVAVGHQTLTIDGDLSVKQTTLAQRTSTVGVPTSPVITVNGRYTQGQPGWFSNLFITLFGVNIWSAPSCGIMDPSFPWDNGMRIAASLGMACNVTTPATWANPSTPPATWPAVKTPVTLPATCAALETSHAGVVTMPVGYYGPAQTDVLTAWFTNRTSCTGKTFWFPPGDYSFDVTGGTGNTRSTLRFNDPASNWVFGTPQGWDPATGRAPSSAYPAACNPGAAGVTVTLSGRTSLRHEAGLVAMCGVDDATTGARKMLYQEPLGATVTWAGEPAAATSVVGTSPNTPAFVNPTNAQASSLPVESGYPTYGSAYDGSEGATVATRLSAVATCGIDVAACSPTITATGFSNPAAPAYSGSTSGMQLKIRASVANVADWASTGGGCAFTSNCSQLYVQITTSDAKTCTVTTDATAGIPRSQSAIYTVDLTACGAQGVTDATQLDGATVRITAQLRRPVCTSYYLFGKFYPCPTMSMSLDYLWLQATTNSPSAPAAFSTLVNTTIGNAIYFFGPVQVPRSQVEVNWQGGASMTTPIFANGLVARALASWPEVGDPTVGLLAAPSVQPAVRKVLVRAMIGGELRGSAIVTLDDANAAGTALDVGRRLQVDDWRFCNEPLPTDGTERPCPAP